MPDLGMLERFLATAHVDPAVLALRPDYRALLHVDQRSATHAGGFRELIEGPSSSLAFLLDPVADRSCQCCRRLVHECTLLHCKCI